jgi:putative transposase
LTRITSAKHTRSLPFSCPITVTDHASRYLLACEALSSTKEQYAFTLLERLFKERGLPANIRSDNGVPFASAHALFNLSKLAVWWLRLGIAIERIQPGHPQQNGRHERMHLTLKKEATNPAGFNLLQQQAKFDDFVEIYNQERPREALAMQCPAEVYRPSTREYKSLLDVDYPFHDRIVIVTHCGRICLGNKKINFSPVLLVRPSVSRKFRMTSGWSASWIMTWAASPKIDCRAIAHPHCS